MTFSRCSRLNVIPAKAGIHLSAARAVERWAPGDPAKRKEVVFEIEKMMAGDVVRPVIYHSRASTCWHPYVKNITQMSNSAYNSWRLEDAWLDK